MSCRVQLGDRSVPLFPSNESRFVEQFDLPMEIQCLGKVLLLSYREKKKQKIDSRDFPVGSFAVIDFYLTLETGHKSIFSMKIIFVRLWFFNQSEFKKKSNSINRVFHHWKPVTSEHWLQWNYFPADQIQSCHQTGLPGHLKIWNSNLSWSVYIILK